MKIESIIRRKNGTRVELDDNVYHFKPTGSDERHLCDVEVRAHVQRFLSIPEGFQPAELSEVVTELVQTQSNQLGEQPVLGTLAGVVDQGGNVKGLLDLGRDSLLVLASDMEIEGAEGMTDEELAAAIAADPVEITDPELIEQPDNTEGVQTTEGQGVTAVGSATDGALSQGDDDGEPKKQPEPKALDRDTLAQQFKAKFGRMPNGKMSAERIKQVLDEEDE